MSISVNGQSKVPPGFRFHPTEEELLQYYLRKKVSLQNIDLDVIQDVDLNKLEPWDIQEKCKIGSTPQNDWYFFSHKDKKYPTGIRTNRATAAGFWKATGRDKVIFSNSRRIGMRKTLVFYKGRAPHGQKSDWIMHEYRLEDNTISDTDTNTDHALNIGVVGETTQKEGWVVCRIFKKKNHYKSLDSDYSPRMNIISASSITTATSRTQFLTSSSSNNNTNETTGSLEQILHEYMGRSCKVDEDEAKYMNSTGTVLYESDQRFMKLPNLESPNSCRNLSNYYQRPVVHVQMLNNEIQQLVGDHPNSVYDHQSPSELTDLNNWAALDRLVASHLRGQKYYDTTTTTSSSKQQLSCFNDDIDHDPPPINFCSSEITNINDLQLQQQQLHSSSSYHMLYGNKPHSTTQDDEHNSCDQSDLWGLI